jgi:hypothetical protein
MISKLEEEVKKRKFNSKGDTQRRMEEDKFLELTENQMSKEQMTRKLSDQGELIAEIFGLLDIKEQVILDLSKTVKNLEESSRMIMNSFQIMQKEIKELKCGFTEKERVAVPQKVTENRPTITVKEPIGEKELPWKTVSSKETNKTSTVKEDYGDMKKEEQIQEGQTWVGKVKKNIQLTSSNTNMQRGRQPSKMSQSQYVAKVREDIRLEKIPCDSLLQKDNFTEGEEIASMTIRLKLTAMGQTCPAASMKKIIEKRVGIQPLSLSVISNRSCQILFKKKDSVSFQNLLIPNQIELMEAKKEDFQQQDVDRIAQLYLRGYFKELARAALQNLPTPTVKLVLARATEFVKSKFQNKLLQKRWLFNIQKDKIAFQPVEMEIGSTNS